MRNFSWESDYDIWNKVTNNLHVHKRDWSTGYAIRSWTYYTHNRREEREREREEKYMNFFMLGSRNLE